MEKEICIVVVNGYGIHEPDFEHVIWGDPKTGRLGRVPMALYVALREKADHVLWGTGASRKFVFGLGELLEGEWIYELAKERSAWLAAQFGTHFSNEDVEVVSALLSANERNHFELSSKNTFDSARYAMLILNDLIKGGPAHVISVSSRNHARAGHHYQMLLQQGYQDIGPLRSSALRVSHVIAGTGYADDGRMEHVSMWEHNDDDQYRPCVPR